MTINNGAPRRQRGGKSRASDETNTQETPNVFAESPLSHALFRVMRAMVFSQKPLAELDSLPLAQLRLLWTVFRCADATMKDFSEVMGVSQSTVTQLADRLVRRGLVERHPDPGDRRIVRLRLSPEGQNLLNRDREQNQRVTQAVWLALTEEARAAAMRGLEILAQAGEQVHSEQGTPLPSWPSANHSEEALSERDESATQPVLDLMTRRVRGKSQPGGR